MDLFERIKDVFGDKISPFDIRIEVVGFDILGVFGGGKVVYISDCEIVFASKKCCVKIFGENLKIARAEQDELYIAGEVFKIEKTK